MKTRQIFVLSNKNKIDACGKFEKYVLFYLLSNENNTAGSEN